ncbi:MAG TPA: ArsA-related P-loop ATPase [Myxococcales bacterium]|nr:ArsA-related P-loop ATPase [Myxococcales bacterium]
MNLSFAQRRLQVCVGSGGVGKTTLAATIALAGAAEGKKTLVCTIDPAKRLGSALGLGSLGNVEAEVPPERLRAAGIAPKGRLFAMMLDLKRSWDDLIAAYAKNAEQRDRIYANRYYQQLSSAVAGSQEYVAVEKLYELAEKRDYDLIVLDTPPTVHALDFLDAPKRVLDFLDNDAARWLLTPALTAGKVGLSILGFGGGRLVKGISRFTGLETLRELADFMLSLSGMYDGFKERAAKVKQLLAGPEASFVLVTSPQPLTVDEALFFHEQLGKYALHVGAVIANRVSPPTGAPPEAELARALERVPPELAARLRGALADAETLWRNDHGQIERLERAGLRPLCLARRATDVHDLPELKALAEELARAAP